MSKVLMVAPSERAKVLEANRRAKMAASAHAYVRGNTWQFYEWLLTDSGKRVPQGPPVWICGDCHVGNLGPLASADGKIAIQIRDLDQTVIGNPAHDLIRLALSLAMAARGSDLPGVTTAVMMEQMMQGYEQSLVAPKRSVKVEGDDLGPIRKALDQAYRRKWRHLAEERIEDVTPQIPLGKRFWTLTDEEKAGIAKLFAAEKTIAKVLHLKGREPGTKLKVLDAAYWMKGCSSLGRLRYAVLLGVGGKGIVGKNDGASGKKDSASGKKDKDQQYCLIDLKEATAAAAPKLKDSPGGHAERVVAGACNLSPYLGERMMAVTLEKKPIVLRELMPQDLKFDLERLTRDEAIAAARYLAEVVGKAHGRQMTTAMSRSWRAELNRNRTKNLDAPGWLWTSVVSLIAAHEVGYLEHSRRYALGG